MRNSYVRLIVFSFLLIGVSVIATQIFRHATSTKVIMHVDRSAPPESTSQTVQSTTKPMQATIHVKNAAQLRVALENVQPGEIVQLEDGNYQGAFVINKPALVAKPITLKGSKGAILNGGSGTKQNTLLLKRADYWRLEGFSIIGGQKGIVLENTNNALLSGLAITEVGQAAILLYSNSADNMIKDNIIRGTGRTSPDFGDGITIGSMIADWPFVTDGSPDVSDRNQIIGNTIAETTGECIDIKEGTTGGIIKNNICDGSQAKPKKVADSWIEIKGNNYTIEGNKGTSASGDGFQTFAVIPGWGNNNTFVSNTGNTASNGYGIAVNKGSGNLVTCDNKVTGAKLGLSNISCTKSAK